MGKYSDYDKIMGRNKGTGKVGRPKLPENIVKNVNINIKISRHDKSFLEYIQEKTGRSKTDLIMSSLRYYWSSLHQKSGQLVSFVDKSKEEN